jgi:ABC-type multidrug transport system fused ATPase/permease subunit
MDLINRANALFHSAEMKRQGRLASRLHAEVLASWSFETLENGERHAASNRFLTYAPKLFALTDNIIAGASSIASAAAAAFLVSMIDWRLSALAVAFIGVRMMRDVREAKNSFALEKRLQGVRQLNETTCAITNDPQNARESNLVQRTDQLQMKYQEGAETINKKELLNETRNQFGRLILDSIPALITTTGIAMLAKQYYSGVASISSIVSEVGYLFNLGSQCRSVGFQVGQIAHNQTFAADGLDFLATKVTHDQQTDISARLEGTPRIVFDGVKVFRKDRCLLDVPHLVIEPGEIIGIVGQEGAGKSVFVRTLLGLINNSEGEVNFKWEEKNLLMRANSNDQRKECLKYIRYFNQDMRPFPGMTLKQLLEFGSVKGREQQEHSLERTIEVCRLKEVIERTPAGLNSRWGNGYPNGVLFNGGAAKQFLLGMVFKPNLPVLVLDEATANLSADTGGLILADVISEARKNGQTVIVVSHNWSNFVGVDRILAISEGKVVQDGKAEELIKAPGYYQRGLFNALRESLMQIGINKQNLDQLRLLLSLERNMVT